jgi:sugar/nucleoside kinase (ribokinase family)
MPSSPQPVFDIITIGESLRDVFYMMDKESASVSMHPDRNLLCLEYAEKIPVEVIVKVPAAGNSANAAVGSARLGLKTALVSWVGADNAGADVMNTLREEGVDERFMVIDKQHSTSEATILVFNRERTQLVHFEHHDYKLPKLPSTRCVYYSAMGKKYTQFDKFLQKYLKSVPETQLIFQPGTTHIRAGLEAIKPLIARSLVFILNKDEAHHLLMDGERTMFNLLEAFHRQGCKNVIITDAANGAEAFDGKNHWHMPVFPAKVLEPTGAGDSFATAVSAALLKGYDLPTALRWGSANGWSVVQYVGPQMGLLKTSQMNATLKQFASIKPKLIAH